MLHLGYCKVPYTEPYTVVVTKAKRAYMKRQ
jgi:hypothetical protein